MTDRTEAPAFWVDLRAAQLSDMEPMNRLAFRSKAHWGYAQPDLERWAEDLRVSPDTVKAWPTFVAESAGALLGWVQSDPTRTPWALEALWVDPAFMGRGIGRRLLAHALVVAATAGQKEMSIDADPYAAGFYLKCGARQTGVVAAPVDGDPDRVRPQFLIETKASVT
jgi:ribosomal protein S18 acetylase RimI-like enzyme